MIGWKYGAGLVVLFGVACSSDEENPTGAGTDASAGGSSGASAGGSGAQGAARGSGGRTTGGNGGSGATAGSTGGGSGAGGAGGRANGSGGATDAGRDGATDGAVTDGHVPDSSVTDANADSAPVDAGCRGPAAAICQTGSWRKYVADGGATCAACPGPTLTCAGFDLAASSFTAANPKRIIKVAVRPGAAEILMDDDLRITATFQGTSCGSNHGVTTFGKARTMVEHDAAGRTFFSVDIGLVNTTMVPCGDVRFVFNDGCCTAQEAHVSAVYDDGSGTTTFSCVDGG